MSSECNNIKLDIRNDKYEVVCAMCKKCLITANHDVCVLNYVNDMNSRSDIQKENVSNVANQKKYKQKVKKPKNVGSKERLASPKTSKPRSYVRWSPTGRTFDRKGKIIGSSDSESQSDCSKGHSNMFMVRRLRLLKAHDGKSETSQKFRLEGNILITRVYFIEGLRHNLFSVGQFYDSDLEVAFRRNTCFVKNLEGVVLLKGNHTTNLYTINLHEMASASPIFLMARVTSTKSWLWHQRLSHLNFDTMNDLAKNDLVTSLLKFKYHKEHLCPSYEQGKSKKSSHPPKPVPNSKQRALCYPKNDRDDIGKLSAKGDIGFFIGYFANSCTYIVYNRRTKKIIETMNVTFDELSAMAFEQSSLKLRLQSMTSRHINSCFNVTYASSTIITQKPTERELDLLFKGMYDDYIGGQQSAATRTTQAAQAPQVLQTPTTSTKITGTALIPTNSSSQAANIPNTSQDVDGLEKQQQDIQQQDNQAPL
ncbi:integrase, catalytic region, zinc finger, CCHC-type containing protein [Tanacetum coccineum]